MFLFVLSQKAQKLVHLALNMSSHLENVLYTCVSLLKHHIYMSKNFDPRLLSAVLHNLLFRKSFPPHKNPVSRQYSLVV